MQKKFLSCHLKKKKKKFKKNRKNLCVDLIWC